MHPGRAQKGEAQRKAEQLLTELHTSVSFRFENGQLVGITHPFIINEGVLLLPIPLSLQKLERLAKKVKC